MLDKFRAAKQPEIDALLTKQEQAICLKPFTGNRPPFARRLRDMGPGAVIAEFKRASPSRGVINDELLPDQAGAIFAQCGAAAMSVLTESVYFKGDLSYLGLAAPSGLPLLRKDFLFHEVQVRETACTPASAFLLIARMADTAAELRGFIELGRKVGLEAVVEIFDERDLGLARDAGAEIIQVNNRDLDTLKMDMSNSRRLAVERTGDETWIAASGVSGPEDVCAMADLGFDAVLVGTMVMAAEDPAIALKSLTTVECKARCESCS